MSQGSVFMKVLKPIRASCVKRVTLSLALDDSLIQGVKFELCIQAVNCTAETLDQLEFTTHPLK